MTILLIIAAVAIFGVLLYAGYLEAKKRREALTALAAELGWSFDPSPDSTIDSRYGHFEVFTRGHSRFGFNTLTGSLTIAGRTYPGQMGDYEYKVTRSNGKSTTTTTHRFSYLILHLPFSNLPTLSIRPEGLWDKLKGALGFDDIDFESAEFSRRFFVQSNDRKFAYAVVHPRMMEFLLASGRPSIHIQNDECCASDGQRRWDAEAFRDKLAWHTAFFEHWPEYLTTELDQRRS